MAVNPETGTYTNSADNAAYFLLIIVVLIAIVAIDRYFHSK
jgi:hypothetical protein